MDEAGLRGCSGLPVGGAGSSPLVDGAGSCHSGGRDVSRVCLAGNCVIRMQSQK